jgi:hypothetical protein
MKAYRRREVNLKSLEMISFTLPPFNPRTLAKSCENRSPVAAAQAVSYITEYFCVWSVTVPEKLLVVQLVENSQPFVEIELPLQCSQGPVRQHHPDQFRSVHTNHSSAPDFPVLGY